MTSRIESWVRYSEERRLMANVRLMEAEQREKYLERVANRYLIEFSETATDLLTEKFHD
jgi:hypothetical protein